MPTVKKSLISFPVIFLAIFLLSATVTAASAKTGIITGDIVNLRANPDTSAKVLAQLEKGKKVSVLDSEGDWFKVSFNDATGWVNDNYVVIRDQVISYGTVSGDVVNVRSKPDISSEILTKLDKGSKVDIYERSGDWCRISIGDERFGWVNKEFMSVRSDTTVASRGLTTDVKPPVKVPDENAGKTAEGSTGDSAVSGTDGNAAEGSGTSVEGSDKISDQRLEIVAYAKKFIGVKYVYGGTTPKGFDCSGFVSYVFNHFDISLERASRDMGNGGAAVKKANLQPGDLVFFDTNGGLNAIRHVGIYIGNNSFIHASSGSGHRKVMISSLSESFYSNSYMRARDYLVE
jgi:cell wall-associated NlpC family hydrolase/SH3-like domain-containing protein